MATVIVIRHNNCQLANQLLHFGAVYAWCLERGHAMHFPAFVEYAQYFPAFDRNPLGSVSPRVRMPSPMWLRRAVNGACRMLAASHVAGTHVRVRHRDPMLVLPPTDPAFVEPAGGRLFLEGWNVRNPLGLQRHAAPLRTLFTPREPEASNIARFTAALPKDRLIIGIHIRHRDYRVYGNGFLFIPIEGFRSLMARIQARHARHRPFFVIASDEPRTAEEFAGFDHVISGGNLIEDLYRLAACDLIVGPSSTYSLWAALMGGTMAQHLIVRPGDPASWCEPGYPVLTEDAQADAWLDARAARLGT
jgi:hypothetical protein